MTETSRDKRLAAAFVSLADTLVAGYDIVDLLQTLVDTCADLLDATAAGLVLADDLGELSVVASTSESSRLVELIQVKAGLGPCVECLTTGQPVVVQDIAAADQWPDFRDSALDHGFHSFYAVPLRLRNAVIGALNLFRTDAGAMLPDDLSVAQGLADVATIGILQERALRESDVARTQLQHALDSRVVIEQAKGVIAQQRDVDMEEAFRLLRSYSRNNNVAMRDVANLVVRRSLSI